MGAWGEWDRGGSDQQAEALAELQRGATTDSGATQQPQPPTDAPAAQTPMASSSGDWKKDVSALGVDPGWVVALRQKLVESGKVSMDDIQAGALADPEHRKWLNRQMRKANEEAAAATASSQAAPAAAPAPTKLTAADTGQQAAAATKKAVPSVLKPGHLPTGPLWQTTAAPGGSGWIPAKDGLWWPPWPVTGGPIAKPAVQDATMQANALDTATGQARQESTGG